MLQLQLLVHAKNSQKRTVCINTVYVIYQFPHLADLTFMFSLISPQPVEIFSCAIHRLKIVCIQNKTIHTTCNQSMQRFIDRCNENTLTTGLKPFGQLPFKMHMYTDSTYSETRTTITSMTTSANTLMLLLLLLLLMSASVRMLGTSWNFLKLQASIQWHYFCHIVPVIRSNCYNITKLLIVNQMSISVYWQSWPLICVVDWSWWHEAWQKRGLS